jgi:hypothetical protein
VPGQQPGFVVVLEQLPDNPRFDREAREQLLDVFRDAADFWGEREYRSDASILFGSPLPGNRVMGAGDGNGPHEAAQDRHRSKAGLPRRQPPKNGANPNFGMNMPMMSSAFDTADVAQRGLTPARLAIERVASATLSCFPGPA